MIVAGEIHVVVYAVAERWRAEPGRLRVRLINAQHSVMSNGSKPLVALSRV
jgi:hypothetical protein